MVSKVPKSDPPAAACPAAAAGRPPPSPAGRNCGDGLAADRSKEDPMVP